MKKIYLFMISAVLMASASCSSFLDQPVKGTENLDTYYQNEQEALTQLTGCYQSVFWDDWWQVTAFYVGSDMASDDLWMGNTTQSQSDWIRMAHYGNPKQDDKVKDFWQFRYKGILRCNIVIDKTPETPVQDEKLQKRIIAEAKFIRAFHYFELAKNFGGVPIVLGMYMPNEVEGIKRATLEETYAQVEKDLLEAIPDLPLRSEYPSTDLGRATQGAAMGYLGKAYLYQEKYTEANEILKELIDTKEYSLCPEFKDVWDVQKNNNQESIFEVQYNSDVSYQLGGMLPVFTGSRNDEGWAWGLPTSDLENAFKAQNDTERLKWTIVINGENVPGDPSALSYLIKPSDHKSGRINRKFYVPRDLRPVPYDGKHNRLNHRLLRYADVLLMYAEVANELGNDAEARKALNEVRSRVNLPEIAISGKELRDAIREERRLELALEHQRLYDLRRWTDDNGKKALANIMGEQGSFVIYNTEESTDPYETTNQKENSNKGITFQEDRDLLFPIPNQEVTMSNGSIEQNPNF